MDVFVNEAPTATSGLGDGRGAFALAVAVRANTANALEVYATPDGGEGLTSPPAAATVTHDDVAAGIGLINSPTGSHVRQTVTVQAQADDPGSGVSSLSLALTAAGEGLTPCWSRRRRIARAPWRASRAR